MTEAEIIRACHLDEQGIIPGKSENAGDFFARASALEKFREQVRNELKSGKCEVLEGVTVKSKDKIAPGLLQPGYELTEKLYGFAAVSVPGFFLTGKVGLLWGGCCIGNDDGTRTVFLLRNIFRKREKWWCYHRTELAAHELCHAARFALNDPEAEEFFAYQTSDRKLRRYLGNCFIYGYDALGFLLPVLFLPLAQYIRLFQYPDLWLWPFWLLAAAYPVFLLCRNQKTRFTVFRAKKKLAELYPGREMAILFRSTVKEMKAIGRTPSSGELEQLLQHWAETSVRWQVILHRFMKCN